ncbi:hypothetical protein JTB14_005664, partial [Gonioctena quinquepunctata]
SVDYEKNQEYIKKKRVELLSDEDKTSVFDDVYLSVEYEPSSENEEESSDEGVPMPRKCAKQDGTNQVVHVSKPTPFASDGPDKLRSGQKNSDYKIDTIDQTIQHVIDEFQIPEVDNVVPVHEIKWTGGDGSSLKKFHFIVQDV